MTSGLALLTVKSTGRGGKQDLTTMAVFYLTLRV